MRRRDLLALIGGAGASWAFVGAASADQTARIGVLSTDRLKTALLERLRDDGFDEGRNLIVEYRPNVPPQLLPYQLAATPRRGAGARNGNG
jgi:hypothetical protein